MEFSDVLCPSRTSAGVETPQGSPESPTTEAQPPGKRKRARKTYQQVQVPTYEQMMQEDFMNNCAVRTGLSGVMGLGLGAMFGIAMGTFDAAVKNFSVLHRDV